MKNIAFCLFYFLFFSVAVNAQETGSFTDSRDGATYKTVKIGNQWWFAENAKFKTKSESWANDGRYPDGGYLYTWQTAQNVCPSGWHLPSLNEWNTLISNLGGESTAGGKLKRTDYGWNANWYGDNSAKFNAVGAGVRDPSTGQINDLGMRAYFWTSTNADYNNAYYIMIISKDYGIKSFNNLKSGGQSVRCIKD